MKNPLAISLLTAAILLGTSGCNTPQSSAADHAAMKTFATHFTTPTTPVSEIASQATGSNHFSLFDQTDGKFVQPGRAIISFVVLTDGTVAEPQIQAATDKSLGVFVCERAKALRFKNPAHARDGHAINALQSISVEIDRDGHIHYADLALDRGSVAALQ